MIPSGLNVGQFWPKFMIQICQVAWNNDQIGRRLVTTTNLYYVDAALKTELMEKA